MSFDPSKGFSLFVDMDGTLAAWHTMPLEALYEKGYYRNLKPYKRVVEAIRRAANYGTPVYILSAYLPDSQHAWREKHEWLDEFAPFIPRERRLLCPQNIPKPEYVTRTIGPINDACFLLDDYSTNLHEWERAGGTGIKLLNGLNGNNGTWKGTAVSRFDSPDDMLDGIFGKWHKMCLEHKGGNNGKG